MKENKEKEIKKLKLKIRQSKKDIKFLKSLLERENYKTDNKLKNVTIKQINNYNEELNCLKKLLKEKLVNFC